MGTQLSLLDPPPEPAAIASEPTPELAAIASPSPDQMAPNLTERQRSSLIADSAMDAEQARQVHDENVAQQKAENERRTSIISASVLEDKEQQRRVEAQLANSLRERKESNSERLQNSVKASAMEDAEQARRVCVATLEQSAAKKRGKRRTPSEPAEGRSAHGPGTHSHSQRRPEQHIVGEKISTPEHRESQHDGGLSPYRENQRLQHESRPTSCSSTPVGTCLLCWGLECVR
eukprot:66413_1